MSFDEKSPLATHSALNLSRKRAYAVFHMCVFGFDAGIWEGVVRLAKVLAQRGTRLKGMAPRGLRDPAQSMREEMARVCRQRCVEAVCVWR